AAEDGHLRRRIDPVAAARAVGGVRLQRARPLRRLDVGTPYGSHRPGTRRGRHQGARRRASGRARRSGRFGGSRTHGVRRLPRRGGLRFRGVRPAPQDLPRARRGLRPAACRDPHRTAAARARVQRSARPRGVRAHRSGADQRRRGDRGVRAVCRHRRIRRAARRRLRRAGHPGSSSARPARRAARQSAARRLAGPGRTAHRSVEGARPMTTGDEQSRIEQALTDEVVASFAGAPERLREVMQSLTRHLHAFIREVRLTEDEWRAAIDFLTAVGKITDDKRQEFILLSDVLGASMQTIAVNNETYRDATEATVFGPFFVADSPFIGQGGDIAGGAPGRPWWVDGAVRDTDGAPVPGARIEVWQADEDGMYDVQYDDPRVAGRGHLFTDDDGSFRFWCLTPTPYPIPHDGPVGRLLDAVGRSPMRAAHLHF